MPVNLNSPEKQLATEARRLFERLNRIASAGVSRVHPIAVAQILGKMIGTNGLGCVKLLSLPE